MLSAVVVGGVPDAAGAGANPTVTVQVVGVGGSISSSPSGITNCKMYKAGTCEASFSASTVTLTATLNVGWQLAAWQVPGGGAFTCSSTGSTAPTGSSGGTSSCTFTLSNDVIVVPVLRGTPLDVTTITWDMLGQDQNSPASGPSQFPVGARVCNRGATNYTAVSAKLVWDSVNTYIGLAGGDSSISLGALNTSGCLDAYFLVEVSQVAAAQNTARRYRIIFETNTGITASTPQNRQLYIQKLGSTNSVSVNAIKGGTCSVPSDYTTCSAPPSALTVGSTYTYKLFGSNGSGGKNGLTSFINFSPSIFQVLSASATFTTPSGATGTSPFADGCGMNQDPTSSLSLNNGGYGACVGPVNFAGGVGGDVVITYQVKVVGVGSQGLTGLFMNYSGASWQYNTNYSTFTKIDVVSKYPLTVAVQGDGRVSANTGAISACTSNSGVCTDSFTQGSTVTLTASANAGSRFVGWGGDQCSGSALTCTVTVSRATNVSALFSNIGVNSQWILSTVLDGDGTGSVSSSPTGISCSSSGGTCSASFNDQTSVTLTAAADPLMIFGGWSGDISEASAGTCTSTSATCTVSVNAMRTIHALFLIDPELTVVVYGNGTVTSDSGGVNCGTGGTSCVGNYALGAVVVLTRTADAGTTFTGWGGACSGTAATCTVTMDVEKTVTATFGTSVYALSVVKDGTGTGTVTSSPAGINCGDSCVSGFNASSSVTLAAAAATDSVFTGWSGGGCSGSASTCTVTMSQVQSVTATFALQYSLSVTQVGSGSISSSPSGISLVAPGTTSVSLNSGTSVVLTATAASGWKLSSWSGGGCSGSASTCTVALTDNTSVTATFVQQYVLSVTQVGSGSVSSSPSGISLAAAGSTTGSFDLNASVTLTATAASGWRFSAWSGGSCSGSASTCTVTMDQARSVTATFVQQYVLSVTQVGSGSVSSSPTGISLAAAGSASASFDTGTDVTLTATAASGWRFDGWSGGCTNPSGPCTLTMNKAWSVTATFVQVFSLSVTQVGSGSVSSSPSGISLAAAGSTTGSFDLNASVTLTATAASGWRFSAWSGGSCSGSASTCTVTMDQARSVTATFVQQYVLSVTQVGSGSVSSSPTGISLAAAGSASASFDTGTDVTLTATAASGYLFDGWTGACSGSSTCTVTMDQARSITATFSLIPPGAKTLTVNISGIGGSVNSDVSGISNCASGSGTCSKSFADGTVVVLTATASGAGEFRGWSGACSNSSGTCTVTMDQARSVTATFVQVFSLSVTQVGSGSVSSSPTGISLVSAGSASKSVDDGTSVTLTATAPSGWRVVWSGGGCLGSASTCTVSVTSNTSVTATFVQQYVLSVTQVGSGSVSSSPSGVSLAAAGSASASFDTGTSVTLTPSAASGWRFDGWSGGCTNPSGPCTVTMDKAWSVTATFVQQYVLSVTQVGSGSVSSSPSRISLAAAGSTSGSFDSETSVTLTATPASGWQISAWSGHCSGTSGSCAVTMSSAKNATVTFEVIPVTTTTTVPATTTSTVPASTTTLAVTTTTAAASTTTTEPRSTTSTSVLATTTTELARTFSTTSTTVPISNSSQIAAAVPIVTLTVTVKGKGKVDGTIQGRATSLTGCTDTGGARCVVAPSGATALKLSPTPDKGWVFAGWSEAANSSTCPGKGSCTVALTSRRSVTATFIQVWTLTVTVRGTSGSVSALVAGKKSGIVDCTASGGVCNANFDDQTALVLRATFGSGSSVDTWSGECSTASGNSCDLTLTRATSISITFATSTSSTTTTLAQSVTTSTVPGATPVSDAPTGGSSGGTSVLVTGEKVAAQFFVSPGNVAGRAVLATSLSESASRQASDIAEIQATEVVSQPSSSDVSKVIDPALVDSTSIKALVTKASMGDMKLVTDLASTGGAWAKVTARVSLYVPGSTVMMVIKSAKLVIGASVVRADGTATIRGLFPVRKAGVGAHAIEIVGTRKIDGVAIDSDGRVDVASEAWNQVNKFDGRAAIVTYARNGQQTVAEIPLETSEPWWAVFIMGVAMVIGVLLRRRRVEHRGWTLIGALGLLIVASAAVQWIGWTQVSNRVMTVSGLVAAFTVFVVVMLPAREAELD